MQSKKKILNIFVDKSDKNGKIYQSNVKVEAIFYPLILQ